MALTKKQRQQVWDKSQGVCWYCGDDLPEKGWHSDHFVPVIRETKYIDGQLVPTGNLENPEMGTLENSVPACAPCNLYKHSFSVDDFRLSIANAPTASRKLTAGFRISERFGLIEVKSQPVVFWFEAQGLIPHI